MFFQIGLICNLGMNIPVILRPGPSVSWAIRTRQDAGTDAGKAVLFYLHNHFFKILILFF
jgi:hypothetical protein